jgi:polar amino acid transport system substrate-binding protein
MMPSAKLFLLAAAGLWGGAAGVWAQATESPVAAANAKSPAPLRVAVYPQAAPMIFKSGGKYTGIEADFARGLAAALGRPVEFVDCDWNNLISAVLDDKADIIMSGLSITGLRQVRVAFCFPYLRIGQVPLCRRGELALYGNNVSLYNIRGVVGVVAGTTADLLVHEQFSYAQRDTYPTLPDAVQGLLDKKADLVLTDFPLALWQSAENESTLAVVPIFLTQEDLAWAVRKDDDALRAAANVYILQIKDNGQLTQIVRKWLPMMADNAIGPSNAPDTEIQAQPTPTLPAPSTPPTGRVN